MRTMRSRVFKLCCGMAIAVFLLTACHRGPSRVLLNVAGSTFGYPIYSRWFSEYHRLHPNVELNYASIGSGGGIQQLRAGTVDFAASDMPLNDQLLSTFKLKIVQFTTVMGATVPIYNIPGVRAELRFTPQALVLGDFSSRNIAMS